MKDKILLISKDVFMRGYLPIYGNKYYKTPNIDELANKGTVFLRHYTAAPSTAMAFTSMFTGLYAFQTDRKKYTEVSEWEGETFFDRMNDLGYKCHVVWDKSYVYLAQRYSKCYGKHTIIHNTDFLTRKQPPHVKGKYDDMSFDKKAEDDCIVKLNNLTKDIVQSDDKVFMWIHLPHALMGRNAYGSDIDVVDRIVGVFREFFSDDAIYITADHGHMNGSHGKYGYGFDVNENAINIPLITPRIDGLSFVDFPTSNTMLGDIILGNIPKKEYLYSETAYYMQPHRKLAIIHGKYKYIYEKLTKNELLYDVIWDPEENNNLINTEIYDVDRKNSFSFTQRFFYPYWNDLPHEIELLRKEKERIWKNAPLFIEIKEGLLLRAKFLYSKMKNH